MVRSMVLVARFMEERVVEMVDSGALAVSDMVEDLLVGVTACTGLTIATGLLGVMGGTWVGGWGCLGTEGAAKKLVMDCWAFLGFLRLDIVLCQPGSTHKESETI